MEVGGCCFCFCFCCFCERGVQVEVEVEVEAEIEIEIEIEEEEGFHRFGVLVVGDYEVVMMMKKMGSEVG